MMCGNCGHESDAALRECDNCGQALPLPGLPPLKQVSAETQLAGQESRVDKLARQPRRFSWTYFSIKQMTLSTAEKHLKNAFYAGLVSLAITILCLLIGVLPPEGWLDVLLTAMLVLGVYRKSRLAAALLFVYFISSKFVLASDFPFAGGVGVTAIVFTFYYLMGFLGSVRYRQLVPYKPNKWTYILTGGSALAVLAAAAFFFASQPLITPDEVLAEIQSNAQASESVEDSIYEADYTEGYKAGYTDGRSEYAMFGDTYLPPATEGRRNPYGIGYLDGYLLGCREGNYDCGDVEEVVSLIGVEGEYEVREN